MFKHCTMSGRYTDMSNEDYHRSPAISKSGMDRLAISPEHYQAYLLERREETPAMKTGTAVHMAVLEPELFKKTYVHFYDAEICESIGGAKPRATNKYKEWKAEFEAEFAGRILLDSTEYREVTDISKSVLSRPVPLKILSAAGAFEHSFFWDDPETGVACRCRPDFLRNDGYIIDLKTTEDASPRGFEKSAEKFRYWVQAAFYKQGVEAVLNIDVKGFVFIAVEKKPPYAVACYTADEAMIAAGIEEVRRCLAIYKACDEADEWPGYPDEIMPLKRPAWAWAREREM